MLDKSKVGYEFSSFEAVVERGRIKFFAQSIGEQNPIYSCEAAARDAGYRTIPAPPTFPMVLDFEGDFLPVVGLLDLDIGRILHGSQQFEFLGTIYAADSITVSSKIKDIFDKKGGALEFVVLENSYVNQDKDLVALASQTLVYRNA